MPKPRVVVSHWVHPDALALLGERCEVVANPTRDSLPGGDLLRRTRGADGLMAFMPDRIDEAFLAACPRLRVVAAALKGYDNFDVGACRRRGVWFTIVPDLLTGPTAELAVGLMLALGRRVLEGDERVRAGAFRGWRPLLHGAGLAGSTVGILGMGEVGRAVAQRLAPFGVRLLYADPIPLSPDESVDLSATRVDLPGLLAEADWLLPLVPLTPATFHLLGATALARVKPGCRIVNVSRGSVVDEVAVTAALASGRLAGYAADVFEMEDWARPDRPTSIPASLLAERERTVFTPHLGSAVEEVRREVALEAARSILEALAGHRPRGALVVPAPFPGTGAAAAQGP